MKFNLLLLLLVVVVSYFTCKNLKKTTEAPQTAPVKTEEYSTSGYNWRASHVIDGENPDTAFTYQVKKAPAHVDVPWQKIEAPTTSRRAFMATGWWVPRFAYQPSDTTVHVNYISKALIFKEDQTFEILQNGKHFDSGHWAYEDAKKLLYLSCNDTYFNNSWKVQENGFRMVLIGNTDLNVTGIQIRLDMTKTPPAGN